MFVEEGANVIIADIDAKGGEETLRNIETADGEAIFVRPTCPEKTMSRTWY